MTPKDKEALQELLIRQCNAASRLGFPEDRLLRDAQRYGFPALTLAELQAELLHLEKADLLKTTEKTLRPDLRQWVTTASGDAWLMKQGLI